MIEPSKEVARLVMEAEARRAKDDLTQVQNGQWASDLVAEYQQQCDMFEAALQWIEEQDD